MQFDVCPVLESEADEVSCVVHASFGLVASYWDPGAREAFLARSSPLSLAEELRAAYAAGAFGVDKMLGLVLMPNPALLGLRVHWV